MPRGSQSLRRRIATAKRWTLRDDRLLLWRSERRDPWQAEVVLSDNDGGSHVFFFEMFFNSYKALTLDHWMSRQTGIVAASAF